MSPERLFSVVIPTYNRRPLLARCLDSVRQASVAGTEIIVVDDGSTDDTAAYVRARVPDVRFVQQENRGVSAARNSGMRLARGRFIAFLDSDDTWYPQKLEVLERILAEVPDSVGLAFHDMDKRVDGDPSGRSYMREYFGGHVPALEAPFGKEGRIRFRGASIDFRFGPLYRGLIRGNVVQPSCAVIRRSVLETLGGFREDLTVAEDSEYFLRIARQYDVLYTPTVLATLEPPRPSSLSRPESNVLKIRNTIDYLETFGRTEPDAGARETIRMRLAELHGLMGYHHLSDRMPRDARPWLLESIRRNPRQTAGYAYLMLSCLPAPCLSAMHRVKRLLATRFRPAGP